MKITSKTTRLQLAAIVTEALQSRGISAVLVGGAVVSIYTENEYESNDLDFISSADQNQIASAMKSIGFLANGRNFEHDSTDLTVEFPPGPLGIGDRVPIKPEGKLLVGTTQVALLSPTQSVMDRLAWFYFNNDRQCLDQALKVASKHPIKLNFIRRWSQDEGMDEKFELFMKRLKEVSRQR